MVLDVKVMCDKEGTDKVEIPEKPVLLQHRLIDCNLVMKEHVIQKALVFVSRCKVWRLKNETVRRFVEEVEKRANDRSTMDVEGAWGGLKSCLLEVSDKVCGKSKGRPEHKATWWWNEELEKAVDKKKSCLQSGGERKLDKLKKNIRQQKR